MTTRLTPAEINKVGEALVGGDLVTELEIIVNERLRDAQASLRVYAEQLRDSASADDRLVAEELDKILEEQYTPEPQHNHDPVGVYPNCPACGTLLKEES